MADGRFPLLSFIPGLISNLIACFRADYSRGRQNIIGLLSLPAFATSVKRRKAGSPFSLTWILPRFWHFNLFLRLWRTAQQNKSTPKKFKDGANLLFRGLIIAKTYASQHAQSDKLSFSNGFIVYVWTDENDAKTLRVEANFFETGEKKVLFHTNTDTWRQGLKSMKRIH